jgi:hypothetical protein
MRRVPTIVLFALAAILPAVPALAQQDFNSRYSIMAPEPGSKPDPPQPWLQPKYKSPHGTRQHVRIPRTAPVPQARIGAPPPIYVPQTGRSLPNLPTLNGAGPNGAETYQDRAARCANQAGIYGSAAGSPSTYINSCINQ